MAEGGVEAARDRLEKPVPKAMVTEGGLSFLETPEGRRLAYHKSDGSSPGVVFVHGLCSTMDEKKARAVEAHCRSRGTAFVRFDLSGHGASSGDLKGSDMSMWLEDLTAVLASLTTGPQVLVGSDVGGWLMFLVTMRNPDRVAGLVGVSVAPDFTQELWKGLDKETRQEAKKTGVYRLASPDDGAEPYEISMRLIQDGSKYTILDMPGIEYIKVPIWMFHGEKDTIVKPNTALQLMQRLQCPVSLKTVDDGDHRLSRPQDVDLITKAVTSLLDPDATSSEADQDDPED